MIPDGRFQSQCSFINSKKSTVIGKPEAEPITESIPHIGHNAVTPTPPTSSTQSRISAGVKVLKQ
jgi:hypothetical protein